MIEKLKELMLGKTIEDIEFMSWQATCDTMILRFTDKSHIKIVSDPKMCFEGLSFYIKKKVVYETEEDEEIK